MTIEIGSARAARARRVRDSRPFDWLRPVRVPEALPADVQDGIAYLQFMAFDDDAAIARLLVRFSLQQRDGRRRPWPKAPTVSVLNRRRRAARMWVNAVLHGDVSRETLHALTRVWLPRLAGTGPDVTRAVARGRIMIEYLRGLFVASVLSEPAPNLLRHAKALYALETVLGVHLQAMRVAAQARPSRTGDAPTRG